MVLLRSVFLASFACALAGCSDDSTEGSPSTTAAASSGGEPSKGPFAAVSLEVYATQMQTCPAGNFHVDIGNPKTAPVETVGDGAEGASVECGVVPEGEKFAANGKVGLDGQTFTFGEVLTGGTAATGRVSVIDLASGTTYTSTDAKPCVFEFLASAGNAVAAGSLSVQFGCGELASGANPADTCSIRNGALVLEGCQDTP